MDYEKDMYIDENALDVEWLEQPSLMGKYTANLAKTRRRYDEAQEKVSIIKAHLERAIRKDPEKFDLEKVTESAIQSAILVQEKFQEANQKVIEARYENQMAQGAVQAVEQRKQALENLIRLLGLNYFAGPTISRDLLSERQQRARVAESNKSIKIGKRRT